VNLTRSNRQSPIANRQSAGGFTMVEIALSLAIIGFALVAIIGVLPAGMSVQKDNREQTVIDLDAAFLMNAIRNGSHGQDDLTNYIVSISNTVSAIAANKSQPTFLEWFDKNQTQINGTGSGTILTNGANIVGLLSTPKYIQENTAGVWGFYSNSVTAVFRAINAPAVDQGQSATSQGFAFQYQVTVEILPSAEYAFTAANNNWINLTAPTNIIATNFAPGDELVAQNLQGNLYDIRLTFRWPVLANNQLGGGRQVFRSTVAGTFQTNNLANGASLFFMQPLTYTAAQ
jgi:type II secretory pathway pseudopilin PulG